MQTYQTIVETIDRITGQRHTFMATIPAESRDAAASAALRQAARELDTLTAGDLLPHQWEAYTTAL